MKPQEEDLEACLISLIQIMRIALGNYEEERRAYIFGRQDLINKVLSARAGILFEITCRNHRVATLLSEMVNLSPKLAVGGSLENLREIVGHENVTLLSLTEQVLQLSHKIEKESLTPMSANFLQKACPKAAFKKQALALMERDANFEEE